MAHEWHLEYRNEDDYYCYHLCLIRIYDDEVITFREQDVALHEDQGFRMKHKQIYISHLKKTHGQEARLELETQIVVYIPATPASPGSFPNAGSPAYPRLTEPESLF